MGLGRSIRNLKYELAEKLSYHFIGDLALDLEEGKKGPKWQALYLQTKGLKTLIGFVAWALLQALDQFQPPWLDSSNFVLRIACGALMAFGVLDKLFRKEPLFPPFVLEVTALLTKYVGWAAAAWTTVLPMVPDLFPGSVVVEHWALTFELWLAAATAACAFINRAARLNALPAQPVGKG